MFAHCQTLVSKKPLVLYALGDWGAISQTVKNVGIQLNELAEIDHPAGILGLGDNFYPAGVNSMDDPRFFTVWYSQLASGRYLKDTPWFLALGNHDYLGNVNAQLGFSFCSKNPMGLWRMWSNNFRTIFKNSETSIETFCIDTNGCQFFQMRDSLRLMLENLDERLENSTAQWKIVYGHHPMYTSGIGYSLMGDVLIREGLLDILKKHGVSMYLSGHEHLMQHKFSEGIHHVGAGVAGGGVLEPLGGYGGSDLDFVQAHTAGFFRISANSKSLMGQFIDEDGNVLREFIKN